MHVLISGAGIAGPSLAWFLAKTGAQITLVEKASGPFSHGQNIDISGTAVSVVKKMGLIDEIRRLNTTEKGTQFIDPRGQPFALFPVVKGGANSFTSEYEILRGDLAAILYEATKGFENVKYVFGTTITEVISNGQDGVKVELSNGEVHEYDLLVAADGQWSKVRKQCFPPDSVTVVDKGMYAAYWTVPRIPEDNEWWNVYHALRSRVISLRPDPHGTARACLSLMPCNDEQKQEWQAATRSDRDTQQALMRKEFADAGWQAHRLLNGMEQAPDFYFQAVQQIKMSKWSDGRVVCLGDTAHAPTPLTGMGTSLAILGGCVLAGELSKLKTGEHPSRALEAYDEVFRPFVEETQKIPSFIPGIAHPATAWKIWLLGCLVSTMSWIASIPGLLNRFDRSKDDFKLPHYPLFDTIAEK